MQEESQTPFASEYQLALAQFVATQDESNLQRARELGGLANSLGVLSHEFVAIHAAALLSCAPEGGVKQFTTAAEFLTRALEALELASAHRRSQVLKRAAHELRTPLTTLRLTLQVGLGRLLKAQGGFTAVTSVRVATRQQAGFGDPDAIFVLTELHLRKRNDHDTPTVARLLSGVKGGFHG